MSDTLSFKRSLILTFFFGMFLVFPYDAMSQPAKIGRNLEEISRLAIQEGRVRMASGLEPAAEALVLQGFRQQFPQIKVEHTELDPPDRERILNEASAGMVEFDVLDVSTNLHVNYIKAKILAGPFDFGSSFLKFQRITSAPTATLSESDLAPTFLPTTPL